MGIILIYPIIYLIGLYSLFFIGKKILDYLPKINRNIENRAKEKNNDFIDYSFGTKDYKKMKLLIVLFSFLLLIGMYYLAKTDTFIGINKFGTLIFESKSQQYNLFNIFIILISLPFFSVNYILDEKYMELNDIITLSIFIILIINLILTKDNFISGIFSSIILFCMFLVIALIFGGLGGGDVKLAGAIGLLIGVQNILVYLFITFFIATIKSIAAMIFKKKKIKEVISFGPCMILSLFISIIIN